jgi:hypothetical protein
MSCEWENMNESRWVSVPKKQTTQQIPARVEKLGSSKLGERSELTVNGRRESCRLY